MMRTVNQLRAGIGFVTRRSPAIRGLGRCYRVLNQCFLRAGADPIVSVTMKDGSAILVDLRTHTDIDAYYRAEYDGLLIQTLKQIINIDHCVLDVGANIGHYTVSLGRFIRDRMGTGRIFSFEPYAGNHRRLLENIERNDLQPICQAFQVGLSDRTERSELILREDFLSGSATGNAAIAINETFDRGFASAPIELTTLDTFLQKYGAKEKIDIIKMDIEGHEGFCLQGARETIGENRPTLLMEVNKPYYSARNSSIEEEVLPRIPPKYRIYRPRQHAWYRVESLAVCDPIDNVMFVPEEKLERSGYQVFR